MTEQQHIPNNDGGISQEQLLAYLEGRLPAAEQREVEKHLAEEGMESDAVEGLQSLKTEEVQHLSHRINHKLRHELRKNSRRRKGLFKDNKWSWIAVIVVLLLCVLCYVVMRLNA